MEWGQYHDMELDQYHGMEWEPDYTLLFPPGDEAVFCEVRGALQSEHDPGEADRLPHHLSSHPPHQ